MAAAVADFRPVSAADRKLERGTGLTLELEPTPDLLAEVARVAHGLDSAGAATREPLRPVPILVGFAAETGSLDRAADKLRRKHLDLIVANDVSAPGVGFAHDTNAVVIVGPDGPLRTVALTDKRTVAAAVLDVVSSLVPPQPEPRRSSETEQS